MKRKVKVEDADIGIYLDTKWRREYRAKYLQGVVEMVMYKGKMLLSVREDTDRAKALAAYGIVVSGDAWMKIGDIDAIMALLREAKAVLRMHQRDIRTVANCEDCRKIFAGLCERHRPLFKKYKSKRPAPPQGVR